MKHTWEITQGHASRSLRSVLTTFLSLSPPITLQHGHSS